MWHPRKLKIEKFISHLSSEYEFQNGKAVLIVGENKDDDSQSSNGSGKSAVIEAIIFALTGDSFRKVRAIDLIMNGEKNANVFFSMENSQSKQVVEIARVLDLKKSSTVEVIINGKLKTDLPTVNDVNKFIIDLLDISKEDLINYFIVSKEKYQSFLNASDTKKKEIISRFSGANLVANVDTEIEKDEKNINQELSNIETKKSKVEGQIEAYEEQLSNLETKDTFEQLKTDKIAELNQKKTDTNKEIEDIDFDISETSKLVKKTEKEISKISTKEFDDKVKKVDEDKEVLKTQVLELKSEIKEIDELIVSINKNLAGVVECPKCEHKFSVTNKDFDVNYANEVLPTLEEESKTKKTELDTLDEQSDTLENLKEQAKKQVRLLNNQKNELEQKVFQLNNKIKSKEAQKELKNDFITSLDTEIRLVEKREFLDDSGEKKIKLKNLKKDLSELEKQISDCDIRKQGVVEWYYNFKKFKTHLANKSIKSVEAFSNMFLTKMKTNLNIKIEGYKLLANGNLKENITVEVLRNGLMEGLFDKFSSGEKVRVDVCTILAMKKLINMSSKNGGLDLLILDEIIESVDVSGSNELLNSLNSINETVLVITHSSHDKDFENILKIKKENGFSCLN